MVGGHYRKRCGTTSTSADVTISDTDTSSLYDDYCYEYEKTETEEKMNRLILKEERNIPKFNDVKKHHNTMKVNTIVAYKHHNFNIRNAL